MKNAIKYYYNLDIQELHQYNQQYIFNNNNIKYILYPYENIEEEIEEKYKFQFYVNTLGIPSNKIVKNNNNRLITRINEKNYVLVQIQIEIRTITEKDIAIFTNTKINTEYFKYINRSNWSKMWKTKIDYIEYQISQFRKKYPCIRESIDYYIGISETCISLLANMKTAPIPLACMHSRISEKTTTLELYNPINFIIDNRIRDIGEYLTEKLYQEKDITNTVDIYIKNNFFTQEEILLLFIRIIYPSNYFDMCEKIIENKCQEQQLRDLLKKTIIYERNIKKLYMYLKKRTPFPEIEWLSNINRY